ncbi:unnamed protein product [Didymodactylos carnosus]|uniref:Uncharacterized protein n=1 Tax=Didymodactylos carnosus TaxID=1234261 RepID=A0A8S2CYR1_9BILA|nr:unnamed protein product [Didymodactylos carnosus]CAF3580227.1 unnamed protein product [Didymodactylos carnosus]
MSQLSISNPITFYAQNTFQTLSFFGLFIGGIILTGAWFGLIIALVIAYFSSFLLNKFLFRKQLPVPSKSCVLVTGSSAGIGLDAVLRLSKIGFTVFAGVRKKSDGEKIKELAGSSNASRIIPVILDITKSDEIKQSVETITQHLSNNNSKLLAIVNNAGYGEILPVEILPLDKLRYQFEVNLFGHVGITQALLPLLRQASSLEHSARIIFISSGLGRISMPSYGAYAGSKFALEALADALRIELKKWSISVSIIEPGRIESKFTNVSENIIKENMKSINNINKIDQSIFNSYQSSMDKSGDSAARGHVSICSDAIQSAILEAKPLERYMAVCNNPVPYPVLDFATPASLQILSAKSHWNADDTLRTPPNYFIKATVWDEFSMKSVVLCLY